MCYPKPGPRCSAHARQTLDSALADVETALDAEDGEAYITAREAVDAAQAIYDRTPEGIASLRIDGEDELAAQYEQERAEAIEDVKFSDHPAREQNNRMLDATEKMTFASAPRDLQRALSSRMESVRANTVRSLRNLGKIGYLTSEQENALIADESNSVRGSLARASYSSEVLAKLSKDSHEWVRIDVAENHHTSDSTLDELAREEYVNTYEVAYGSDQVDEVPGTEIGREPSEAALRAQKRIGERARRRQEMEAQLAEFANGEGDRSDVEEVAFYDGDATPEQIASARNLLGAGGEPKSLSDDLGLRRSDILSR